MDREELTTLIKRGPIRIRMNDGRAYDVEKPEFASVSDISAAVLYRGEDGKLRHMHLPLVTMSGVEPLETGTP
jgi:hypothetical protein